MNHKFIEIIKEFLVKYYLIILGGLLFLIYFWNRFFRTRLSKNLPLDLTILKFFITFYVCLIFFYILVSLLRSRKKNVLIEQIINWLFIPIMEFDKFLKNHIFIKKVYEKFLNFIIPRLDFFVIQTNLFYIIFWICPRIILLTALFVDVFIFHKLHYKYMVILFGLLLFFNRYFKYSLKNTKDQMIQYYGQYINSVQVDYCPGIHPSELEPDFDPDEGDYDETMCLPLDIFIKFSVESRVFNDEIIKTYFISTTLKLREELWEKYIQQKAPGVYLTSKEIPQDYINIFGNNVPQNYLKADNLVIEKKREFAKEAIDEILKIALVLEYYNYTSNYDSEIKNLKILIYLNYLICWLYILIISLPTLNVLELIITINLTWLQIENPFVF